MTTMKDITREGNPIPCAAAEEVPVLIIEENRQLGEDILTFLKNSQDPAKVEKLRLRGGVGLAVPQLDISKRTIVAHVPSNDSESGMPSLSTVIYNPKILGHSVQDVCLGEGEGCLSVGRDVPGYAARHNKITVSYLDMDGEKHKARLKNYEVIVVQHETDHINDIMFYDHISKKNPFALKEGVLAIE